MPKRKWLILGDSNLSRFPTYTEQNLQIESYPGATFRHAEAILARTPVTPEVERVILSFGINNKTNNPNTVSIPQFDKAVLMAKQAFPRARVLVPIINYSRALARNEQANLSELNNHIVGYDDIIPQLSLNIFSTEGDLVHWSKNTAEQMLDHWIAYLNGKSP